MHACNTGLGLIYRVLFIISNNILFMSLCKITESIAYNCMEN